jgi:hypothetical protein
MYLMIYAFFCGEEDGVGTCISIGSVSGYRIIHYPSPSHVLPFFYQRDQQGGQRRMHDTSHRLVKDRALSAHRNFIRVVKRLLVEEIDYMCLLREGKKSLGLMRAGRWHGERG